MRKYISTVIIILLILNILPTNYIPLYLPTARAEWGAPPDNGTTNKTWYINATDQVSRVNENISTEVIQINETGAMDWVNITAKINGSILINDSGYFNMTDCNITLNKNAAKFELDTYYEKISDRESAIRTHEEFMKVIKKGIIKREIEPKDFEKICSFSKGLIDYKKKLGDAREALRMFIAKSFSIEDLLFY